MWTLRMASVAFLITLTACGDGGGGGDPKAGGLSGNWQMTLQGTSSAETGSGFLVQSGKALTGSILLSGQTVAGETTCIGVGSVLGEANGSLVTITASPVGQTLNLTGTPANSFASMSGNYSILASGCGQT